MGIVTKLKAHYDWDEVEVLLADGDAPTADDVSITADGRRLDSASAVVAFFDELRAERGSTADQPG